jgi:glycosyltransferase involved in cell wall biosynthesis
MKIAIVMPLAEQRGGAELTLWHLMQHRQGENVDWLAIFLENGSMVAQVQSLGVETCLVPAGRLREPHLFMAAVIQIASIARRSRADLIFSWMTKAHLYSSLAAKLAGIPSLWYQHGLPSTQSWMDTIATMLPACGVLACSKAGAEAQARLRPLRPIRILYPGVELERFNPGVLPSPEEMRRKLGLPESGPLIGLVGRLQRWKGIHVLVDAMPKVLRSYPDAHCVVVGGKHDLEPDYPAYLEGKIAALGMRDQVTMVGLQRNIPEWMQAMDVIVHASDYEPFGLVVIEAMALGKPVVAGARGGPSEIVTDGVNGFLTPYSDAEALASAILRYLDDREFARSLGAAARERTLDFSTQRYAQNFIEAVRDLLSSVS